jgi:hypothetical protein
MAERSTGGHSEAWRQTLEMGLDPSSFRSPRRPSDARRSRDLHICPGCGAEFVYPVDWAPAGRSRWSVYLRCPECEWTGGGVYEQAVVDRFDEALDRATESVLDDLKALAQANMLEQIDGFVAALWADQVLPEDF